MAAHPPHGDPITQITACSGEFMARGARIAGFGRRAFAGTDALCVGPREIAHCHNSQVDVRLTRVVVRELRDELRGDARIALGGPGFDWVLVRVRNAADVERAIELLRHVIRAAKPLIARVA